MSVGRTSLGHLPAALLDALESPTCAVDQDGTVVFVNLAWRTFRAANGGSSTHSDVGANCFTVCAAGAEAGESYAADVAQGLREVLAGARPRFELEQPCPAGSVERWFSLRITPMPPAGACLTYVDVSLAKRSERALLRQRLHDPITGLPNRTLLDDRLAQALVAAGRHRRQVTVGFLNLDRFSRVNGSLGHRAGDALLQQVATRLSLGLHEGDTLSRFGGDEFVLVWSARPTDPPVAALAETLLRSLDEPFEVDGSPVQLTASLGLSAGTSESGADALLLAAHTAMKEAKLRAPGHSWRSTDQLGTAARQSLQIETELRRALTDGELVVHYQPVCDVRRGIVSGVEALVRWEHEGVLRMPDTFIPVAEASGLVVPLGAWVFERACEQSAAWARAGRGLSVAVNLSVRQITEPALVDDILGSVRRSGVDPRTLLLEVTESTVLQADVAQAVLKDIAALGAGIAMDDFGVGHNSLAYLKQYPVHALKVDRSFTAGLGVHLEDNAVVASVIHLAAALGATSIAEGVETVAQYLSLQALGCEYVQGFLFSPAVPAAALPEAVLTCNELLAQLHVAPRVVDLREASARPRRWADRS